MSEKHSKGTPNRNEKLKSWGSVSGAPSVGSSKQDSGKAPPGVSKSKMQTGYSSSLPFKVGGKKGKKP